MNEPKYFKSNKILFFYIIYFKLLFGAQTLILTWICKKLKRLMKSSLKPYLTFQVDLYWIQLQYNRSRTKKTCTLKTWFLRILIEKSLEINTFRSQIVALDSRLQDFLAVSPSNFAVFIRLQIENNAKCLSKFCLFQFLSRIKYEIEIHKFYNFNNFCSTKRHCYLLFKEMYTSRNKPNKIWLPI